MTSPVATRRVERVRHELKRRDVRVLRIEDLTPHVRRITFADESLADFTSLSFDDHVKVFFDGGAGAEPARRDYTPRRHDNAAYSPRMVDNTPPPRPRRPQRPRTDVQRPPPGC